MRTLTVLLVLALSATPARAHEHTYSHAVSRFVEAWNAHDSVAMARRFSADATAIDGTAVQGRAALASHFTAGTSSLRLVSTPILQRVGTIERVDFDVEISQRGGAVRRHVTIDLIWGPDLPGGHHPDGRLFISSLRIEPVGLTISPLRLLPLFWSHFR